MQRNPNTVRQELKLLDGLIPETDSMDIYFNEMPGLQNTGKFIINEIFLFEIKQQCHISRTFEMSPHLPRQMRRLLQEMWM
jgi:hypothetical protein